MDRSARSPRIVELTWGCVKVEGQNAAYKDAKLFPGGSREWDWGETGTGHTPGIQPGDVEELLAHGAEVMVFGKGINERLQVCQETLDLLKDRNVPVHVLQTEAAVRLYNELAETKRVGGLFHSTC